MIAIIDFGSQTAHLIGRRLRDLGIAVEYVEPEDAVATIARLSPAGIIFSGGPSSVYEQGAPTIDTKIFDLGLPVLGICYGWQLMARLLGGEVKSGKKEYGPTQFRKLSESLLLHNLPAVSKVFESHGDTVAKMPNEFHIIGSTEDVTIAAAADEERKLYGVQFHPEMHHTQYGKKILGNFATRICNLPVKYVRINTNALINEIRETVGDAEVIGAFSGGTDSVVAGALVAKAVGKQFVPVYIDSGFMRADTLGRIENDFPAILGLPVKVIHAKEEFLSRLQGVADPESKRKVIGKLYIELFERELQYHPRAKFLLQGTTYADFIHSQGTKLSAHIKSHHNVGGLPKDMKLKLLEPIRYYYTDQVRKIGSRLGLPKDMVFQQPFPGPGHAVRIIGEITPKRLEQQILADMIVVDELKKSGWYDRVFQCWSIMTGTNSTAVKGDGRFFGEVVAVRIIDSKDRMTAGWVRLPYNVLSKISTRIVNEVPDVSRVVYDITTKPPATMEWE